jgi:predicted dehydrogenase
MKNLINEKIGVGIIGLGGVGERVMNAFLQHPSTHIVGICDTNVERLAHFSQTYKDIQFYSDYQELLRNDDIQLVYIAVPPKPHYTITLDALKNKKHILCEKPLAHSISEAEEMFRKADEQGIVHTMNFPTFYRSAFKSFYEIVNSNGLGDIQRIQVKAHFPKWPRDWQQNNWINSREQGGFIREIMPHYIHLIQYLFGPIVNIYSQVTYPTDPKISENGLIASAQLQNGTPILFDVLSGTSQTEVMEFTIYGTKGTLCLKDWYQLYFAKKNREMVRIEVSPTDHLLELVDNIVKCIDGKESTLISFKEGLEVQHVLEKLVVQIKE